MNDVTRQAIDEPAAWRARHPNLNGGAWLLRQDDVTAEDKAAGWSSEPMFSLGPVVMPENTALTGDAKLAHDQCRAMLYMALALAEVYRSRLDILSTLGDRFGSQLGESSAWHMETVGNMLDGMDACDGDLDGWLDPIFLAAQLRWPQ